MVSKLTHMSFIHDLIHIKPSQTKHCMYIRDCDGPDGAGLHTAPTCSAAASGDLNMPSTCSNHNLPGLPRREARCSKGPLLLPELLASRSAAVERKTSDIEKQEGEDDGESRADSIVSSSGAEATMPSAEYTAEEEPKKPVVPSRVEGDDLWEAGRECQPRFRRSVADAGVWIFRG
ncbi:hypothetical protein NDU88_007292 [Pleurodeles waltl]|uniref:Uncharacterized protein n=1 Tax=Pleurodeles waltl TaxID=8319 RepID=A0AAV7N1P2_PLEWA|nr:hypothetical protein NDU88_007292 [Pleurodeles waltl]